MEYCNEVKGFINYTLSNPINISGGGIRYPYKMENADNVFDFQSGKQKFPGFGVTYNWIKQSIF